MKPKVYTFWGLPTIKLKLYTFGGLTNSATKIVTIVVIIIVLRVQCYSCPAFRLLLFCPAMPFWPDYGYEDCYSHSHVHYF